MKEKRDCLLLSLCLVKLSQSTYFIVSFFNFLYGSFVLLIINEVFGMPVVFGNANEFCQQNLLFIKDLLHLIEGSVQRQQK